MNWIKRQNWYWSLYYEYGFRWFWTPNPRPWRIIVLPGEEPPFPRQGWKQEITHIQPLSEVVRSRIHADDLASEND